MLIGIHGKIGAGKDTVADFICKTYNFDNKKFADKLKNITSYLTGCDLEDCYTQEGKNTYLDNWNMTIGEFQQKLGTDAIRNNLHKDAWVLSLFSAYNDKKSNWVISDVRFENEINKITELQGISIKIIRPNQITHSRNVNHISETALDNYNSWDEIIYNNGSIEDLYNKISLIMEKYI